MVQNGYAILFLLVLAAGLLSVIRSFHESWGRVAEALGAAPSSSVPAVYSTTMLPAAEVPWVAERMVLRELDEVLPEAVILPAWVARPVTFAARV